MNYQVEFKPRAIKDLESVTSKMQERILVGIEKLQDNLAGDVKRLTNFVPAYRLRIGNYRILFELEDEKIIIYRILPRNEAYTKGKH